MKLKPAPLTIVLLSLAVAGLSACLLTGVGARSPSPAPAAPAVERPKASSSIQEVPSALERALRRRIRQLEDELAAARNPAARTNDPLKAEIHAMPQQGGFRPPSPREMMENLRKSDPAKYANIQKHVAEMRRRHQARTRSTLEFLGAVDASGMSEAERTNHERLQELLAQRGNLPEITMDMDEADMREAWRQRHELDRAIREANAAERRTLLAQTAKALGLEGDEATVLTEAIGEIVSATDSGRGGPPGPPPGPPGDGGR